MGVLTKFFSHKSSLADVMRALDNFAGDTKTLTELQTKAKSYFGSNWKFNLEMHISSLTQNERAHYYEIFKRASEYEMGVAYWASAVQLTSYLKPISKEDLCDLDKYKKYLPKFGIEGNRLYQKLSELFAITKHEEQNKEKIEKYYYKYDSDKTEVVDNKKQDTKTKTKDIKDYVNKVRENVLNQVDKITDDLDSNNEVFTDEGKTELSSDLSEKENYYDNLSDADIENTTTSAKSISFKIDTSTDDIIHITENIAESDEKTNLDSNTLNENSINQITQKSTPEKTENKKQNDINWYINSFNTMHKFMPELRLIMSAVSLHKKAKSLEKYRGYAFLIDTLDCLIDRGEYIMQNAKNEKTLSVTKQLLDYYKKQKNDEIVMPDNMDFDDETTEKKPYKNPYE